MLRRFAVIIAIMLAAIFALQTPAMAGPQQTVAATGNPDSCQNGQGQIETATFELTGIAADQKPPSITVNHNDRTSQTQTVNDHGFDGLTATYTAKLTAPLADDRKAVVVVKDTWKGTFQLVSCTYRTLKAAQVFVKPQPCGDLTKVPPQKFTLYVQNDNSTAVEYTIAVEQYGVVTLPVGRYTTGSHEYQKPQANATYNFTISWPGGKTTLTAKVDGCSIDEVLPSASPSASASTTSTPSTSPTATSAPTRSKQPQAADSGVSGRTWVIVLLIASSLFVIAATIGYYLWRHWNDPDLDYDDEGNDECDPVSGPPCP